MLIPSSFQRGAVAILNTLHLFTALPSSWKVRYQAVLLKVEF